MLDPQTRAEIEHLWFWVEEYSCHAYLELPLKTGGDGELPRLTERGGDGPSGQDVDDDHQCLVTGFFLSQRAAEHAARRRVPDHGEATRYFATLELRDAPFLDATGQPWLSEELLSRNDAQANLALRAICDIGAPGVFITGRRSPRVAVIFLAKLGDTVDVLKEGPYTLDRESGEWREDVVKDPRFTWNGTALIRSRPERISDWSIAKIALFVWWELLFAFVASLIIHPVLGLLGARVAIPIWGVLAVTVPLAWFSGRELVHMTRRARRRVLVSLRAYVRRELERIAEQNRKELSSMGEDRDC